MLAYTTRSLAAKVHRTGLIPAARTLAVVPFKLADIGEGIAEVELMKWFVKEGDRVKSFDRICEVQSDKATVEITSRFDGIVAKVHHKDGDIVKVGSALVDIDTGDSAAPVTSTAEKKPSSSPKPSVSSSSSAAAAASPAASPAASVDNTVNNEKVLTTPAVRKIAKENNVDLTRVAGTGPKNRILKEDVLLFVQNKARGVSSSSSSTSHTATSSAAATATTTNTAVIGQDVRVPIRGVQRLMVKSMTAALQVQHLTYCEEIQFDALKALRSDLKSSLSKRHNVKLSYMPLLIKAASMALSHFPQLNATVNADCTEVTHHAAHNIGVAMDTAKGLVVPVLKNVQAKSVVDLAIELSALQDAATNGTITEAQLSGGTFTLSNIGSVGGTYAVPVLVVPQVLIGAFGRLQVVPRYVNGRGSPATAEEVDDGAAEVRPVTIMNVSWSADHRVVDGATVARFSNAWKRFIEQPHLMLAEMR